jgi:hypothetical protein
MPSRKESEQLGLATTWTMAAAAKEYRETLVIEAKIKDNPDLRRAWIKRQLELEIPTDEIPTPARAAFINEEGRTVDMSPPVPAG